MPMIGVLGGLGPAATVDFLDRVIRLTPAGCDQEHIPTVIASLPHVPDRSASILGMGPDPLPGLLRGLELLNAAGVGVVVIPCNSAHHWYTQLCEYSNAPILHIGRACVDRIAQPPGTRVLVLGTRGTLQSGFYQAALEQARLVPLEPDRQVVQPWVDECIRLVKAGATPEAGTYLDRVFHYARSLRVSAAIFGCTELPIAARFCDAQGLALADSTHALAEAAVAFAIERGWDRPVHTARSR